MSVHALPIDSECETLDGGSVRLILRGELDMATAPLVERALYDCAARNPRRVLVDVARLTFIDATGLRLLNDFDRVLGERGAELYLSRPSWQVSRVLDTVGERCRLRIAPD